ncbi:methyl-accepting chemotaxis protein [Oscillospiraceae bacterium PP1C4]
MKIKRIGTRILVVAGVCLLLTSVLTLLTVRTGSAMIIDGILKEDTQISMSAMQNMVEEIKVSTLSFAEQISKSNSVQRAVISNNKSQTLIAVSTVQWLERTEYVTITDAKGKVIVRTHSEDSGDSVADRKSISSALTGASGSYIEMGTEKELWVRSTAPFKNSAGQIIGAVSADYMLNNTEFVDKLKSMTGMEFTIFLGDERINTTIAQGEERIVGTKLDPAIADVVLGKKEAYIHETTILENRYFAIYQPLVNSAGEAMGVFFTGKPVDNIQTAEQWIAMVTGVIVLIVSLASLLYFARFSKKKIGAPVARLSMMAKELSEGKLNVDVLTHQSDDEIGELGKALESTSETLRNYITDITEHLTSLSNGDMTMPITQEYIGDFIPIQTALVKISDSLNHTLSAINISAEQVHSGSTQVSSGAQALAAGATEQASVIEELSASIEEVSEKAGKNAGSVRQATEYVEQSVTGVAESNEYMKQMLSSMKEISDASNEISKIIKVIDDIAFQTNILALNAAVEAARAGASGKGFAVVADEVRNLAGKSANAAKQTEELINTSVRAVKDGSKIAENTAKALNNVSTKSNLVKEIIAEIENASDAQATAISQITSGIEQISSVVQTNAATAEESSASSEELSAQAALLKEEISKFHLSGESDDTERSAKTTVIPLECKLTYEEQDDYGKY